MTVVFIKRAKSKGYIRIGVESGAEKFDFTVSESEYCEAGSPTLRENLTRDTFGALRIADMRYRARLKALRVLSYGDNSEKMLARKLSSAGISSDIISETVDEMLSLGYINSARQIERLVLNEVNLHHYGPLKIIPKLIAKGYKKSEISEVIRSLTEKGEIDFDKSKERLIASSLDADADGEQIKKLLYKNGYYVC